MAVQAEDIRGEVILEEDGVQAGEEADSAEEALEAEAVNSDDSAMR